MGYIHPKADRKRQPETFVAAIVYQVAVALFIIGGFGFFMFRLKGKSKKGTKV
jgi:hypothetical protein